MLGAVAGTVDSSRVPIKSKLILGGTAAQPVKMHIHRFGLARHDGVVGNYGGGGVIGL